MKFNMFGSNVIFVHLSTRCGAVMESRDPKLYANQLKITIFTNQMGIKLRQLHKPFVESVFSFSEHLNYDLFQYHSIHN